MRNFKLTFSIVSLLAGVFLLYGCQDLDVSNVNEPTRDAVLSDADNTLKVLRGGYQTASFAMVDYWGIHVNMLSDQRTTTNAFDAYWDFSEEPRKRLDNTTSYDADGAISSFWNDFNSSISVGNQFIDLIENEGEELVTNEGVNLTETVLAQAYFLRGISRGYIGLIYDQGYLLEAGDDGEDAEFQPYEDLILAGVSDIETAIGLVEDNADFEFAVMPNNGDQWSREEFLDIANSFAAKILAGMARTPEERDNLDWERIGQFADAGLGGPNAQSGLQDFTAQNVSGGDFFNFTANNLNYVITCGDGLASCSGYNPMDVMVIHLLDPDYPTEYPEEEAGASEATLDPAESDDPRLGYYVYTTNPGFLDPNRNPNLFSNYFSLRTFANNNWTTASYGVTLMTSVENDLLRAEAELMQDNKIEAANILNNSTAGDGTMSLSIDLPAVQLGFMDENGFSGGHSYDGTESLAEFQWALLREYTVEVSLLGGVGVQWYFMRRHDLLQPGTLTMYPVPGEELELTGREYYTFGGVENAGEVGAATGNNSWTELAEKAFGGTAKAEQNDKKYSPVFDIDFDVSPIQGRKGVGNQ